MKPRTMVSVTWMIAMTILTILECAVYAGSSSSPTCDNDSDCEIMVGRGSKCLKRTRTCSNNPFVAGCLRAIQKENGVSDSDASTTRNFDNYHRSLLDHLQRRLHDGSDDHQSIHNINLQEKRICNSDDTNDSDTERYCQKSDFNYPEVVVHHSNWESSIFYSWVVQIFLMEVLHVPVRVGLGIDDSKEASFYNPEGILAYSTEAYPFGAIGVANSVGGRCELTNENCVHVMPEVWIGQEKLWKKALADGQIDQITENGEIGKISWYIPQFTADRYPQLVSVHGLSNNRQELSKVFKRPTTWLDYCEQVSPTKCAEPDDFAPGGFPMDSSLQYSYYVGEDAYIGHFRYTSDNNCTLNPDNCTGHIVGPTCDWDTYVDSQAYWNNISLVSNGNNGYNDGYTYDEMIQIWRAANATSSDVIMWWWTPDATMEEFEGTPAAFQQVLLPTPTIECRNSRIDPVDRCDPNPAVRRGAKEGSCDDEANALQTVIASSLRDLTFATPEAERSPGYQAILNLRINQLQMTVMLRKWVDGGRSGLAARRAVCEFVAENIEELESYIPRGYPRVYREQNSYHSILNYCAIAVGSGAALYVVVVSILIYRYREAKVIVYAQVSFMFMILFGLFLVALGSIFFAMEPKNPVCVSQMWMITMGYTLELVPLVVKVAALNRLVAATKKMKRIKMNPRNLFLTVALLVFTMTIFMTFWTLFDPPRRTEEIYLVDESELISMVQCSADSSVWGIVVLCWDALLTICATVLAFQSRNVAQEFNESRALGTMIYSHFVFGILQGIVFSLRGSGGSTGDSSPGIEPQVLAVAMSFLLSADVITALSIYVVPKIAKAKASPTYNSSDVLASSDPSQQSGSLVSSRRNPNSVSRIKRGSVSRMTVSSGGRSNRSPQTVDMATGRQLVIKNHTLDDSSDFDEEQTIDEGGPRFSNNVGRLSRSNSKKNISSLLADSKIESIVEEVDEDDEDSEVGKEKTDIENSESIPAVSLEEEAIKTTPAPPLDPVSAKTR